MYLPDDRPAFLCTLMKQSKKNKRLLLFFTNEARARDCSG